MNNDETNPEAIDPALEARVVAWVLGEASPFEVAELERKIAEDPRLEIFKRRIEAVHGLLGEATAPVHAPQRLAEDRRAKLLAALGAGEAVSVTEKALPVVAVGSRRMGWWRQWGIPMAASAALLIGGFSFYAWNSARLSDSRDFAAKSPAFSTNPEMLAVEKKQNDGPVTLSVFEANSVARGHTERQSELASPGSPAAVNNRLTLGNEQAGIRSGFSSGAVTVLNGGSNVSLSDISSGLAPKDQVTTEGGAIALSNAPNFGVVAGVGDSYVAGAKSTASEKAEGMDAGSITSSNSSQNDHIVHLSAFTVEAKGNPNTSGPVQPNPIAGIFARGQTDSISPIPAPPSPAASADGLNLSSEGGMAATVPGASEDQPFSFQKPAAFSGVGAMLGALSLSANTKPDTKETSKDSTAPSRELPDSSQTGEVVQLSAFKVEAAPDTRVASSARQRQSIQNTVAARSLPAGPGNEADDGAPRPAPPPGAPSLDESLRTEVTATAQPLSTFSLHVSDVSFRLAFDALARGQWPDSESIRPEEFYNAFDYGDPSPAPGEPVACHVEQSAHPFLQQRNLVRIAVKVPATGREADQSLRLTLLLDTSGSMQREDRTATAQRAVQVLASLLGPKDRVTLIGFAREPRLLADRFTGAQAKSLVDLVKHTPAEGGTNLEEALKLAGARARLQYLAGAQNRIVVLSDGAANLGSDDPDRLASQVAALRQEGIAFDACGVGTDGLNDSILEALTRKGEGRYYVINSPEEADAGFAHQLAGAFRPAAENVKLQVRFNPARVGAYRLIGFEQHRLRAEDFRNDQVSAAQLSAEEAAVALYQVQVRPEGEGELGEVSVRFRQTATNQMVERTWPLTYDPQAPAFAEARPSMQLAGCAAFLAEKLRGGTLADQIRLPDFAPIVDTFQSSFAHDNRVRQLETMYRETSAMLAR